MEGRDGIAVPPLVSSRSENYLVLSMAQAGSHRLCVDGR